MQVSHSEIKERQISEIKRRKNAHKERRKSKKRGKREQQEGRKFTKIRTGENERAQSDQMQRSRRRRGKRALIEAVARSMVC